MKILQGDCLETLKTLEDNSVDAVVTDPPYGLSFMGKKWDYDVPSVEIWQECLRVLKPGGYLLAFAGTRTQHRMAVRIEDAGFEIRDMIAWVYGQGFPKSTNIFKQLIKECNCGNMEAYEKKTISIEQETKYDLRPLQQTDLSKTKPFNKEQGEILQSSLQEQGSQATMLWEEPQESSVRGEEWILEGGNNSQKTEGELQGSDISKVSEGISANGKEGRIYNATQTSDGSTLETTIDENGDSASHRPQPEQQQDREPCAFCKQWGTQALGALGFGSALKPSLEPITVARKPISEKSLALNFLKWKVGGINIDECRVGTEEVQTSARKTLGDGIKYGKSKPFEASEMRTGRFPANLIHDGSDEVVELFPNSKSKQRRGKQLGIMGKFSGQEDVSMGHTDSGSASRFFYCAKSSKKERNKGCDGLEDHAGGSNAKGYTEDVARGLDRNRPTKNFHPTVKPIALMEYLVKLVSREGAIILDPFMGSGSTGVACKNLNRDFIGCEIDEDYIKIAKARMSYEKNITR